MFYGGPIQQYISLFQSICICILLDHQYNCTQVMFAESRNSLGQTYKQVLMNRRKKQYEDRQSLSLSILSLLPDRISKQVRPRHDLQYNLSPKKISNNHGDIRSQSTNRKSLANNLFYKKSNQKQRKIFNKLKMNNFYGTHKINHIIFKSQIEHLIDKIEKRALMKNPFLPISQRKLISYGKPSFKLSDACKVSHMNLNTESRYTKQDTISKNSPQKCKSPSIRRYQCKSVSLNGTVGNNFKIMKPKTPKEEQLQGWQKQAPIRFLTHYESDFDSIY